MSKKKAQAVKGKRADRYEYGNIASEDGRAGPSSFILYLVVYDREPAGRCA